MPDKSSTTSGIDASKPERTLGSDTQGMAPDGIRDAETETEGGLAPDPSTSITSGMQVGSQVPAPEAVQVDCKVIEGSGSGDSRKFDKTDVTAAEKNQAGPRDETTDTENEGQ